MSDKETSKIHLVQFPFFLILGTITWALITNTSMRALLANTLGFLSLYYFFYHLYGLYFEDKLKIRRKKSSRKEKKSN